MSEVNMVTSTSSQFGKIDIVISSILPSLPPPRSNRHTSSATRIQHRPTKVARLPLRGEKRTVEWAMPKHALLRGSSAESQLEGQPPSRTQLHTSQHPCAQQTTEDWTQAK